MNAASFNARALLWRQVRSGREDHSAGLIFACRCLGLLTADEAEQWRRVLVQREPPPPAPGRPDAAEEHLGSLLAALAPMSRSPEPAAVSAHRRFHAALAALHASGVLDDETARRWRSRGLASEAPWLDEEERAELSSPPGFYAIGVPPASPQEAADDAADERAFELLVRRGRARRVIPARPLRRHDRLAVVAVVTRTDATEVLFHYVGEPHGDVRPGFAAMEAHSRIVDTLKSPALTDDQGTAYEPVDQRPVISQGVGGRPDPKRLRVITGAWRYQPPAPDSATAYDVGGRWRLK
jgi:hypothetical protein